MQSTACNECARLIWEWCESRNIWLSAEFIPGSKNFAADKKSRVFYDNTEWMLDKNIFTAVVERLGGEE